jgi:hypothetical protein
VSTKREIKGFWWAPEHPETRWLGTLAVGPDQSPTLEVFTEPTEFFKEVTLPGGVIHGNDESGKPVTLLFVSPPMSSWSSGMTRRSFHAGYALLGIAVPDADSFVAHELRLKLQHLYGWLGLSGFIRGVPADPEEFVVRYRQPDEVRFQITPELEVGLGMEFHMRNGAQDKSLKEEAWAIFRSPKGFPLRRCFDLANALRLLLHLAVLRRVYPVLIETRKKGHGYQLGDRWHDQDIEVCGSILREQTDQDPIGGRWTFRFEDVRNNFAVFFRDWLRYVEEYREALGCYSGTVYQSLTSELDHLSLTQALDAYHGVKFQAHGDRGGIRPKIEQLAGLHAASLRGLVDDIPAFAKEVQVTRNFYTHHNPDLRTTGKVAEKTALIRLNEKLTLLFQMCVLADMGIPADRFPDLRRQLATEIIQYA